MSGTPFLCTRCDARWTHEGPSETAQCPKCDNRAPQRRTETGRFAKGQSGNPGGRPKADPEVVEALRGLTTKAVQTLRKIIDDFNGHAETSEGTERVPAAVARAAADSIIDRFMGKAPAAPEDNDAISRGLGFTRDEVAQMLLGRRLPERSEDPLAIPATTKE